MKSSKKNKNNKQSKNEEVYDENKEYEVERITDMRSYQKQNKITKKFEVVTEYLVKWVGYEELTWEPLSNLDNCKILLGEFFKKKEKEKEKKIKEEKKNNKKEKQEKKISQKRSQTLANKTKIIEHLSNKNKTIFKPNQLSTHEIIGNTNNITQNKNNSFINKEKKDKRNMSVNKNKINKNSILNKSQPKTINNNSKDHRQKSKKENNNIENGNIINNNTLKINNHVQAYGTKIVINNMDFNDIPKNNIKEKSNIINDTMSNEKFIKYKTSNDELDDKIKLNQIPNGIEGETDELLNKKRKRENEYENNDDKNNEIIVKEINSIEIPKDIRNKFMINITYVNKYDNQIYTKDFESSNKMIPREYLVKYYEYLFFEKNKGKKFYDKLAFV